MGNTRSVEENSHSITSIHDPFWNPRNRNMNRETSQSTSDTSREDARKEYRQHLQQDLQEFKQELKRKHDKRRELIVERKREFKQIKDELESLKEENEMLKKQLTIDQKESNQVSPSLELVENLKDENDELKLQVEKLKIHLKDGDEINTKNKELRIVVSEMQLDLQKLNSEMINIEQERVEYSKHIAALKDVVKATKDMLEIRDSQIQGLKGKVKTMEELLASKEMKIMADGLREEYEKQLRNIRNLRTLYDERQRLDKIDKDHIQVQLEETRKQVENEQKISNDRLERIQELEHDNSGKYDQITSLQSSLGLSKAESSELQAEIDVINQLFSQILLGFNNSQEIDLDTLIQRLEENHDLLTDIASNEESHSTAAALPKVLLDLINQINNERQPNNSSIDQQAVANEIHLLNSPEEIVENLPKVWKVLIELLSHQNPPLSALKEGEKDPCYKSVQTPTGPKLKLSVSQTFIRLKDLIIEKKFLEREMYRLKHLNIHLEGRLQDQEKRLELVSDELTTTWHVVEKMQRQHQQLHTHEKVLRYELHEKRKLLTQLKEELQYCREKWGQARAKNDTTQEQWKELRKEFASRKKQADDFNQSAESGYSDDKDSSEDDEKGYESDVSEGKRESDCDDLDNLQSAILKNSHRHASRIQFDENNKTNKTEISFERIFEESTRMLRGTNIAEVSSVNNEQENGLVISQAENLHTNTVNLSQQDNGVCPASSLNRNEIISVQVDSSSGAIKRTTHQILVEKSNEQTLEVQVNDNVTLRDRETDEISSALDQLNENKESLDLLSEDELQDEACSSAKIRTTKANRTPEKIFADREEHLKRLEEESNNLFKKVTKTNLKSNNISRKLDSLHEIYGETSSDNSRSTLEKDNLSETESVNSICQSNIETITTREVQMIYNEDILKTEESTD